ncbi:hypothetical protein NKDENANG_02833 [Candidatus Entotheonellaceae bacterium PAL068K]
MENYPSTEIWTLSEYAPADRETAIAQTRQQINVLKLQMVDDHLANFKFNAPGEARRELVPLSSNGESAIRFMEMFIDELLDEKVKHAALEAERNYRAAIVAGTPDALELKREWSKCEASLKERVDAREEHGRKMREQIEDRKRARGVSAAEERTERERQERERQERQVREMHDRVRREREKLERLKADTAAERERLERERLESQRLESQRLDRWEREQRLDWQELELLERGDRTPQHNSAGEEAWGCAFAFLVFIIVVVVAVIGLMSL